MIYHMYAHDGREDEILSLLGQTGIKDVLKIPHKEGGFLLIPEEGVDLETWAPVILYNNQELIRCLYPCESIAVE